MENLDLNDSSVISAAQNNVYCELDGESVILSMADGVYYGLNPVGHRVWELIQQPRSLKDILQVLGDEYEVDPADCRRDVQSLLTQLAGRGLIEINDAPSG